ncbi:hypothetical protein AB2M62_12470 [Sphingomonas sp. MMS12-HWE2-04]|uniref:hypothetical protein n=1 Tax=Sphingomonas sp. MMS12-HWE2-04 TaxID=3234199 RepID=UPI00385104DA
MADGSDSASTVAIIDTLIESQALLASSIYVELVNLGLIDRETAAARLRAFADLAASPLHAHPQVAEALGRRVRDYADGLAQATAAVITPHLRLIDGGRS